MNSNSRLESSLRRAPQLGALGAAGLAVFALLTWVFGQWPVGTFGRSYVPMAVFAVAACLGFALLWARRDAHLLRHQLQTERERLALAQRVEHLMKSANDIILLADHDWRILEVNDRAVESYGYSRNELLRMAVPDLRAPEARADFARQTGQVITQGHGVLQTVNQRKDGSTFPVEVSARDVEIGGAHFKLGIIRDITERKRAEEVLRASERQWKMTFNAISDAVCLVDAEGGVLRCNRAMEALFGNSPASIVGRRCYEVVHGTAARIPGCPIVRARESKRRETEALQIGERWFEVIVDPLLNAEGEFAGGAHVMTDITERKCADAEIRRMLDTAERTRRTLLDTLEDQARAEQALRKSEASLAAAQTLAKLGSWELDIATQTGWWSAELFRLYGRDPALGPMMREEFLGMVHPGDHDTTPAP